MSWVALAAATVLLLTLAIVVAFAVRPSRARRGGDRSVVRATLVVAALWAGASAIGAAVALLSGLLAPTVEITLPVREFWPELPAGVVVEGAPATREGGGFTWVTLTVAELGTAARVMWAIGQALGLLVPGAIAGLLALACYQLQAGRPFAPVLARMSTATGVVVALGGTAAAVLGDVAGSIASHELFTGAGGSWQDIPGIEDPFEAWLPQATLMVEFPFWPIAAGLGFAAVAAIFRSGLQLQRDTRGLV